MVSREGLRHRYREMIDISCFKLIMLEESLHVWQYFPKFVDHTVSCSHLHRPEPFSFPGFNVVSHASRGIASRMAGNGSEKICHHFFSFQFGKLLNFENGMAEVERTSPTCPMSTHHLKMPLGKAAIKPRICTVPSRLHGICTTQTSMKNLQIQHSRNVLPCYKKSSPHLPIYLQPTSLRVLLTRLRPTGAEPGRIRGAEDGREGGLLQGGVLETWRCEKCVSLMLFEWRFGMNELESETSTESS